MGASTLAVPRALRQCRFDQAKENTRRDIAFKAPADMGFAAAAEHQFPGIAGEPGMLVGGWSDLQRARRFDEARDPEYMAAWVDKYPLVPFAHHQRPAR